MLPRGAALVRDEAVTTLGTLPGFDWSEGRAMENRSVAEYVLGYAWKDSTRAARSFLWHDASAGDSDTHGSALVALDSLSAARRTYAWRMNQSLEMVGWSEFAVDPYSVNKYSATIWRNGQAIDLNALIGDPRWDLQVASSINDSGMIVGNGLFGGEPHGFLLAPAELVVDGNRDGEMSFTDPVIHDQDQTSLERPYRFWLNDDDDTDLTYPDAGGGFPAEIERVPATRPDSSLHEIVSKRNLEDFSRLWIHINGVQAAVLSGAVQIGLKWRTISSGMPAINIYPSADGEGSDNYLKDDSAAQAQIEGTFGHVVTDANGKQTVDSNGLFIFKTSYWTGLGGQNSKKCLLFEGVGEGTGELELT